MERSVWTVVLVLLAALGTACSSIAGLAVDLDGGSTGGDGGAGDGGTNGGPTPTGCDDEVRNNSETDVDCGGSCGGCELAGRCDVAADCLSGQCALNSCRPAGLYVFDDAYAPGISYSPFLSSVGTVVVDSAEAYVGTAALRMEVPESGYNGASLQAPAADLTTYDALVFWAKASAAKTLDVVGVGADGTGDGLRVERKALSLTTIWTRFVVPIPDPSVMSATVDHFHFAEGSDEGAYTVWFDEIHFARLGDVLGAPEAELQGGPAALAPLQEFTVGAPVVRYTVDGAEITVEAGAGHFAFQSSDDKVATVDAQGKGKALVEGKAEITASLRGVQAKGARVITVGAARPSTAAPKPTEAAAAVLSLFSGAYTNLPVDTFSAVWDQADEKEATVAGDAVRLYTNLNYAGIEFTTSTVNASAMDTLHLDVWTPDATVLRVKVVDFGGDGKYDGGDDREHELTLDVSSSPPLVTGRWISLDLPLARFTGLTTRAHLAQLVLGAATASAGPATVFLDNLYFYNAP